MTEGLQNQAGLDAAPQSEGLITQDKANYLITKAKEHAYEKGMQEAEARLKTNQQPQMTPDQFLEMAKQAAKDAVSETLASKEQDYSTQNILGKIKEGVADGKRDYADFEEVAGNVNFEEAPNILRYLADNPDRHHIMYELGDNPGKLAQLQVLLLSKQHKSAEKMVRDIAKSVSDNQRIKAEAAKTREPKPVSNLKATATGTVGGLSGTPTSQSEMEQALFALRMKKGG